MVMAHESTVLATKPSSCASRYTTYVPFAYDAEFEYASDGELRDEQAAPRPRIVPGARRAPAKARECTRSPRGVDVRTVPPFLAPAAADG